MMTCVAMLCMALALGPAPETGPGPGLVVDTASFATILPERTVVYVSVRDLPACLRKAKALPLCKVFEEEAILEKVVPPEALKEFQAFRAKYVEPLGKILRGEVAVALTDLDGGGNGPSLVLLADVSGAEVALRDYLERTIYPVLKERGMEPEALTLGDTSVTQLANPNGFGPAVLFGVKQGVLVASPRRDTLEAVLKSFAGGKKGSLAAAQHFVKVQAAIGAADVVGYLNAAALIERSRQQAVEHGWGEYFKQNWAIVEAITGLDSSAFLAVGMGMTFAPEGGTTAVHLAVDGGKGGIFGVLARKAPPLKSVRYVADDAAFYAACSLGALEKVYAEFLSALQKWDEAMGQGDVHHAHVGARPDFERSIKQIEEVLDLRLDEKFLAAFGGEVAVAAWVPEALTIPPAAVMIEVKDKAAVAKMVARVFEMVKEATAGTITPETKMVGGVKVQTVPGVPQVTPAVAIVGDFLVVATHPDVVENMIDTAAGGKDLGQSADYRRYVSSLAGDATVTVYVALKRLFDFGYPLLVNHVAAIEGQGPDEAEPGSSMSAVKALGAFGECLSGLGIKVSGDEKGVTVSSRSRNGGLGSTSLLSAVFGAFWVFRTSQMVIELHEGMEIEDFEEDMIEEEDLGVDDEDLRLDDEALKEGLGDERD